MEDLENTIRAIVRRFSSNIEDIDDFEQIARIKIWELQEKDSNLPVPYLVTSAKNAILYEIKKRKAKKRCPEGKIISLSSEIGDDDTVLEDLIGQEDMNFEILEDSINDILKNNYGHFYLRELRKKHNHKEIIRNIIRVSIEDISKIKKKDIPKKVNYKFFIDLGLGRILWTFYKNSPFLAVNNAYKGEFFPWNFERAPQSIWKGSNGYENALIAMEWFVKIKNIKSEKDCRKISTNDFVKLGLSGMLQIQFNDSPLIALKTQFPELNSWETNRTPNGFFDSKENRVNALLGYLNNNKLPSILGLSPESVYELGLRKVVSKDSLCNYGLRGLLKLYENSPYDLFKDIFPVQILPWTLGFSKKVWKEDPFGTAAKAVQWLFEDYLEIPEEEIPEYATCNLFWDVGFSGILTNRTLKFNSSPYNAINNAYPGEFHKKDFDKHRRIKKLDIKCLRRKH